MGDFTAKYLQARLSGMNRATVDPRVNQRRVMASPEFALAKALGISTPYNSGGNQIDVNRMMRRASPENSSSMDREFAQKRLDEFNQRNAGVELNPVMAVAGLGSMQDAIPNERPSVTIPSEPEKPSEPRKPISPRQPVPGAPTPGPSAPQQTGAEEAARPISRVDAESATRAPIGAQNRPPIAPYGQPEMQTPQRQTTKGPRLDTDRINATVERQEAATRSLDQENDAGNSGMDGELATGKFAIAAERNAAQDEREAIKKDYDRQVGNQANVAARNKKFFGNEAGPDGGKSFAAQDRPAPLRPLGNARRGDGGPGGYGAEGIMTNRPAQSQTELEDRAQKFAADGERNRAAREQKKTEDFAVKERQQRFPVKDQGKPTERGYAGPQPRYLGGGTIRRV
jgi:hypothetical protein